MGYAYVLGDVLAQGSHPPKGAKLASAFDTLVLAAEEYQPPSATDPFRFDDVTVLHVPLDDHRPTRDEIYLAIFAGRNVARRIRSGQRVLSTCWMGYNRSGLISGIAMVDLGLPADEAIARVRNARGRNALNNEHFEKVIRVFDQMR